VHRYRDGVIPAVADDNPAAANLRRARAGAAEQIDDALAAFDFRRAVEAVVRIGDEGNRYVESTTPWVLAKAEKKDGAAPDALDAVLAELVATARDLAEHLTPFLPAAAERIRQQTGDGGDRVTEPAPVFPRLELASVD